MLILLFYLLNVLLLFSGIAFIRPKSGERIFSIALLRNLFGIPLLSGEYIYLAYHFEQQAAQLVLFSEIIFALLWFSLAFRLRNVADTKNNNSKRYFLIEPTIAVIAVYFLAGGSTHLSESGLTFRNYSPEYFAALFVLTTVFYTSWRLEQFFRELNTAQRWEYRAMVVGSFFISGALLWSSSYRLTYLSIPPRHFLLLAAFLLSGWTLMIYGVVNHRLLNRKIFISRKVVYSFAVPSILAAYLLGFGVISLIINTFELQLPSVLKWVFVVLGCIAIVLFSISGRVRRRIQFFVSTHFYVNKYEYRDEWLALSQELQGALTENNVVLALCQVLAESLYTTEIFIWTGDSSRGYTLVYAPDISDIHNDTHKIAAHEPLIYFIMAHSHFHLHDPEPDSAWQNIVNTKEELLNNLNLVLLSPISAGGNLIGLIGLGPEYTGGQYGHDDFDLLTALGGQTASALMAVRMAEELANTREKQAWDHLSAFVLHDIKNAATMLSLVKENAPEHIHEPDFQQDMLELIDDVLKRMARVEKRLLTLKDEIRPDLQPVELNQFLQTSCHRLKAKLPSLTIDFEYNDDVLVHSDPELLFSILENLLLNSFEAQREGAVVKIRTGKQSATGEGFVEITDNGPGIMETLLPDILFQPFKTNKKGGSGIGLWQAKKVIRSLRGTITAQNNPQGGACFKLYLPLPAVSGN